MAKFQKNLDYLTQQVKEQEAGLQEAKQYLIQNGFSENQISYTYKPRKKDITGEIIDFATKGHFNIVAMNRKPGKVTRFLTGGVFNKVVSVLKDKSGIRNVPIIAMTAHAMSGDREKNIEAGMNDHVTKPIDPNELFTALVKWIEPGDLELPEHLTDKIEDEPEEKPLTDMPGISVKKGLARFAGNIKLYKNIMTKFYCDYSIVTQEITEALDKGEQELSQRLAHTVKGVSGNIGAEDLYVTAGELEAAIKHGKTDEINGLIDNFSEALNVVLDSLKGIIELKDDAEE